MLMLNKIKIIIFINNSSIYFDTKFGLKEGRHPDNTKFWVFIEGQKYGVKEKYKNFIDFEIHTFMFGIPNKNNKNKKTIKMKKTLYLHNGKD